LRHAAFTCSRAGGCLWLAPFGGRAEESVEKARAAAIAVIDFDYVDTVVAAREAGADVVLVGGLQKTSTLVHGQRSRRSM
jgi:hypothetical protein